MADQVLGIKIKIDSETGKLTILNKEFDNLKSSSARASSQLSSLDGTIAAINTRMVAVVAAGYAAKQMFDNTVGSGIALNSKFEQMKLGIASLIAVNSSNITAMGHSITTVQKFQMAQAQAAESVDLLRKANLQTPATLAQITEGYQAALGPSLRLGLSTKQTVEYVKLMTMAAAAMGQPIEQIAQESRALLSGEIDMNAQVARNLQITNEQIKMHTKQGDLYEFLTKKLGDFAAGGEAMSNSWEGISSNIIDSIEGIQKKATEGIFENLKADGIDLQKKLTENADNIAASFAQGFSNIYLAGSSAVENIYLAFSISFQSIDTLLNVFVGAFSGSIDDMNSKYRELGFFDYLTLGVIVAIEGIRQLGSVGLSVITFLGSMMNTFQSITLNAFAGIAGAMGKLTDMVGLDGSSFYESQAYWVAKSNAVKADGLLIDQTQKAILGDMGKGVDRLAHSYNQLALKKEVATRPVNSDSLQAAKSEAAAKTAAELAKEKDAAKKLADEIERKDKIEHDGRVKAMKDIQKVADGEKKWYEDRKKEAEEYAQLTFQADQDREAALKTYNAGVVSAQIDYYTSIGDTSSAYYLQEEQKMARLAETGWYTNEQMLAIKTADNEKFSKEQWKKDNEFWDGLFENINKSMESQFFDAMTGKFESFGDWLKDFWGSITNSLARGLSKSLADTILGTGTNSGGGLVNVLKSFGGFGSVFGSSSIGSSLSTLGGITDAMGFTTTSGGTVINAAGKVTKSGSDAESALSLLNNASTANSLYTTVSSAISNGFSLSGTFGSAIESMAPYIPAMQVAGAYAGSYYTGRGIDKLTGSNTYAGDVYGQVKDFGKMTTGEKVILGALSMIPGGSIIAGGLIGKTTKKLKDSGIQAYGTQSAEATDLDYYRVIKTTKKSWFKSSSKTKTYFDDMSEKDQKNIRSMFGTYDYLLNQLGDLDKTFVKAGQYTKNTFINAVQKSFIKQFVDDQSMTNTFYKSWTAYAKSIKQSISETFSQVVGQYVGTTRSFKEWSLGSGSIEQLKFTSDYLSKDLAALESSMGVSGVTVDNYLSMYDEAIKNTFTPETISTWKSLGDALMTATDANTKYTDSLNSLTANSPIVPVDMNLSKSTDATQFFQNISAQSDTLKYSFAEMISLLGKMLYNQQFGVQPI